MEEIMKAKKFLLVLMALVMTFSVALVAVSCKPKEEPAPPAEEKEFTTDDAINEITNALKDTYLFDSNAHFGWDIDATISGYNIASKGYLDKASAAKTKADLAISQNGNQLVRLAADDDFLYVETEGTDKRFKDFQLYETFKNATMPTNAEGEENIGYLQLAMNVLFSDDNATVKKVGKNPYKYTLQGNLGSLVGTVNGLLADAGITGLENVVAKLAECDVTLKATVYNGKLNDFKFDLTTPAGNVDLDVDKLVLSNEIEPEIVTPAKDSPDYEESNILNFTVLGQFAFNEKGADYIKTNLVTYDYELRVDFNLFRAIRESLKVVDGVVTFDGTKLFSADSDDRIFFDVRHICDENCGSFCSSRVESAPGSILTIAYAPQDFGTNNINILLHPEAILSTTALKTLENLIGMEDVLSKLDGYLNISLDIAALLDPATSAADSSDIPVEGGDPVVPETPVEETATASFLEQVNVLKLAKDILALGTTVDISSGLELGVKELADVVDNFANMVPGFNISNLIYELLLRDGVETAKITVDHCVIADPDTAEMNIYDRTIELYPGSEEGKWFNGSIVIYSLTDGPVKDVEFEKAGDSDNVILRNRKKSNYTLDGKIIPMTVADVDQLLNTWNDMAFVNYNYTNHLGQAKVAQTKIKKVVGLDYTKVGQVQKIQLVTDMIDGVNGLSALLNGVAGTGLLENPNIPGAVLETEIMIIDDIDYSTGRFVQRTSYEKGGKLIEVTEDQLFDPEKLYKIGEEIAMDWVYEVEINGQVKYEVAKMKVEKSQYMNNAANTSMPVQKVTSFVDFTITYTFKEFTKVITVKVAPNQQADTQPPLNYTSMVMHAGNDLTIPNSTKFSVKDTTTGYSELSYYPKNYSDIEILNKDDAFIAEHFEFGRIASGVPFVKAIKLPADMNTIFTLKVQYGDGFVKDIPVKIGYTMMTATMTANGIYKAPAEGYSYAIAYKFKKDKLGSYGANNMFVNFTGLGYAVKDKPSFGGRFTWNTTQLITDFEVYTDLARTTQITPEAGLETVGNNTQEYTVYFFIKDTSAVQLPEELVGNANMRIEVKVNDFKNAQNQASPSVILTSYIVGSMWEYAELPQA